MKKKLILILALVFSLTACGAKNGGKSSTDSDTIKIGSFGPLTGEVATYGVTATNGAKLAIEEINANGGILGKKVEYILEDDKGDTTEAVNIYNKLMDQGVHAILGGITSAPSEAVASLAVNDKIPMMTPSGTQLGITKDRPNVYRVCFTDPYQGEIIVQYLANKGVKKVAFMKNNSSEYSDGIITAAVEKAKSLGMEIVAQESYGNADKDFKVQLTNIKAAQPEALVIGDYYEVDALIASQAKEVGLKASIVGSDGWDGILKQVEKSNYDALEGIVFANHYSIEDPDERIQNFLKKYRETYKDEPSAFSALAYDNVYMFKEAMEKAGTTDFDKVNEALRSIQFNGLTGKLTFDENNNPIKSVTMVKIQNGQYKLDSVVNPN